MGLSDPTRDPLKCRGWGEVVFDCHPAAKVLNKAERGAYMAEVLTLNTLRELTTALEASIVKLTRETPSGGSRRIGDASFTVWYCSDIWEWEYQGETFWDVQDLAEAMIQRSTAALQQALLSSKKTIAHWSRSKTKHPVRVASPDAPRSLGEVFQDRSTVRMRPGSRRPANPRNLQAPGGHVARAPCANPCPCATPCATPPGHQIVRQ
jgi:hypothetical protein